MIKALATDLVGLLATVKDMKPDSDYSEKWQTFAYELRWEVEQLEWISSTIVETNRMTLEAQAGGPKSAEQFREIGVRLNALIFASKIMEVFISHVWTLAVFGHVAYDHLSKEMDLLHRELNAPLAQLKLLDNRMANEASKALLDYSWRWEFLNWIDELEEAMESWRRVTGLVNIAMLAMTLYDVWALPGVGGGGKPPTIGGGGIGEAGRSPWPPQMCHVRRVARGAASPCRDGAIESPGLVKVLGRGIAIERPPALRSPPARERRRAAARPRRPHHPPGVRPRDFRRRKRTRSPSATPRVSQNSARASEA